MHPLLTSRKSNQRYLKFFERFIIETDTISHSIFFSIISISRFYQSMTCPSFKDISFYLRMQFSNFSSSNPPSLRYIFNLISLLIVRLIGIRFSFIFIIIRIRMYIIHMQGKLIENRHFKYRVIGRLSVH